MTNRRSQRQEVGRLYLYKVKFIPCNQRYHIKEKRREPNYRLGSEEIRYWLCEYNKHQIYNTSNIYELRHKTGGLFRIQPTGLTFSNSPLHVVYECTHVCVCALLFYRNVNFETKTVLFYLCLDTLSSLVF